MTKTAKRVWKGETRKVADLHPHPDNQFIYGDEPDQKFIDDVRARGVTDSLVITRKNVIISGHVRWLAAKIVDLKEVPVIVFESDDELEIREELVRCNLNRRKQSKFQRLCEAEVLYEVEQEMARLRQKELAGTRKGDPKENLPEGQKKKGQTRDIIGKQVGVSGRTLDKALKVVKLIRSGVAKKKAEHLKELLDKGNVTRAYNEAFPKESGNGAAKPKPAPAPEGGNSVPEPRKDSRWAERRPDADYLDATGLLFKINQEILNPVGLRLIVSDKELTVYTLDEGEPAGTTSHGEG
jgi:ParB-like chromosome segregation protein Spo0J